MSRTTPAARVAVHGLGLLQVLLLLAGCGGGDPVEVGGPPGSRSNAGLVDPESDGPLDMVCTGESLEGRVHHLYLVTVLPDESIKAFCQASADDPKRQAQSVRNYDGRVDAAAAWAECVVELPVSIEGAMSTTWRYRSHVALSSAGTVYGGIEPGDGLSCYRIPTG